MIDNWSLDLVFVVFLLLSSENMDELVGTTFVHHLHHGLAAGTRLQRESAESVLCESTGWMELTIKRIGFFLKFADCVTHLLPQ